MADLTSERAISFYTPDYYPQSKYATMYREFRPSVNINRDGYQPGSSFSITLSGFGKQSFLYTDECFLNFQAVVQATASNWESTIVDKDTPADKSKDVSVEQHDLPLPCGIDGGNRDYTHDKAGGIGKICSSFLGSEAYMPQVQWGCPFFRSVSASINGTNMSSDVIKGNSAFSSGYLMSSRLLCSSTTASDPITMGDYGLNGRAKLAGGYSSVDKLHGLNGTLGIRGINSNDIVNPSQSILSVMKGRGTPYSIPLSAFCQLFNKLSSLLPIGYLSLGSDSLTFTFDLATNDNGAVYFAGSGDPSSDDGVVVMNGANPAQNTPGKFNHEYWGANVEQSFITTTGTSVSVGNRVQELGDTTPCIAKYTTLKLFDPRIFITYLQINDEEILKQIAAMFQGTISIPTGIAGVPPIPVPMMLKHQAIQVQQPQNISSTGDFNIQIPGNHPSIRSILVRIFRGAPSSSGLRYLCDQEPNCVFEDLQLTVGTTQYPFSSLRDQTTLLHQRKSKDGKPLVAPTCSLASPTPMRTQAASLYNMYRLCKSDFSLFSERDFEDDPMANLMTRAYTGTEGSKASLIKNGFYYSNGKFEAGTAGTAGTPSSGTEAGKDYNFIDPSFSRAIGDRTFGGSPNLFVFPLQSFLQTVDSVSDAFATRGSDMRGITNFNLSGRVKFMEKHLLNRGGVSGLDVGGVGGVIADDPAVTTDTAYPTVSDAYIQVLICTDEYVNVVAGATDFRYIYKLAALTG